MSTLEDKILGEKRQYYCSSSEDEDEENANADSDKEYDDIKNNENIAQYIEPSFSEWDGTSSNTGPKGVIKDWQRYKQMEAEKREAQEREKMELIKKLSLTCRSALDEEKEKMQLTSQAALEDLLNDEFEREYRKRRMLEMIAYNQKQMFGEIFNLQSADEFLDVVDCEHSKATIIVHIYEHNIPGCEAMNGCLISLAQDYAHVKFCKILGSTVGLSSKFKKYGVPALLVYKQKQLIGNFVHMTDHLGVDFYASDVKEFLIEHGILNDEDCQSFSIFSKNENKVSNK